MASRYPSPRLVKTHQTYTVDEAARLLGKHKNTIRAWLRSGLVSIDAQRPTLILGVELKRFLQSCRDKSKHACSPGHLYCVKCRVPKPAAENMAEYIPITATAGNLRGICPTCHILIHRRVTWSKIDQVRGALEITVAQPSRHIDERNGPSVNYYFNKG